MALGYGRVSTNNFSTAKFIVDTNGIQNGATHSTITAALASASSGDDIFIRPGTYTENLTLKAGVNLIGFQGDQLTPNVTIVGKLSFSSAGSVTISNIRLQTNSDFLLAVTGSVASVVTLDHCYLNCTNNTGISYTSSSASSAVNIIYSSGNIGTTGISLFSSSGAGNVNINWSGCSNTGASTTSSTFSAGLIGLNYSSLNFPITTSGTSTIFVYYTLLSGQAINTTALTVGGSGANNTAISSHIESGTSPAISISTSFTATNLQIVSSNANMIDGTGTLTHSGCAFKGTNTPIASTITQTLRAFGPKLIINNAAATTITSVVAQSAFSGGANLLSVGNASTSASSDAYLQAFTNSGTGGDPYTLYSIVGAQTWTTGADNSDSDAYVISASSTLGTSNVMRAATTGNVDFPTSISIASGTALTTYTESTFTPTVQTSNGDMTGISYAVQQGTYQRIGNFVNVSLNVTWTNTGAGTGALVITGLPFTIQNVSNYSPIGSIFWSNITMPAGGLFACALLEVNTTRFQLGVSKSAAAGVTVGTAAFTSANVRASFTYKV